MNECQKKDDLPKQQIRKTQRYEKRNTSTYKKISRKKLNRKK